MFPGTTPFPTPRGTPGSSGPPGLTSFTPLSAGLHTATAIVGSSSSTSRPNMPVGAVANPSGQPQIYTPYLSGLPVAGAHQGPWLPPQMTRPPLLPYPTAFPGPYPFPVHGIPSTILPNDAHPPGVTPVGNAVLTPLSSASDNQPRGNTSLQADTNPSSTGNQNHGNENDNTSQKDTAIPDQLNAWTAHKSEAGVLYFYNASTGESTYEKPPGFKGEPDKVFVRPTPVSMVNIPGTDWVIVTTSDGKTYYYNNQTKTSSWQIPNEVAEFRKKQDVDISKAQMANSVNDKGPELVSLSAPAINTGGRNATSLKSLGVQCSSSTLDLVKKKLQDAGAPVSLSPLHTSPTTISELNGSRVPDSTAKANPSENSKEKPKDVSGDGNTSDVSTDSEDEDSGPSKEDCIKQFKEMLRERNVAPFSKWDKELPKIVFDPRFKAIPSHSSRRALFEHYVKTRAEEERREKRAAQKAVVEAFRQLLDEASEEIDMNTDYQSFRKRWGNDPRFEALDRKDREQLLNERVLPLRKAAEEKAKAIRAAAASSFKSMLQEKGDISISSRWSRVKDSLRYDPRYRAVNHDEREMLFDKYLSELRATEEGAEQETKAKREEQEKLRERERELRKRKEREEQEMERMRIKIRRNEAVTSFQALLMETVKDPQASWTESKPRLEKDPQRRASNPDLDPSDMEKHFREHTKMLHEKCAQDFRALLAKVLTPEAANRETEDGRTPLTSWSTAKRLLKTDPIYNKTPRKEREALWRRFADEALKRQESVHDSKEEKHAGSSKSRSSVLDSRSSYER